MRWGIIAALVLSCGVGLADDLPTYERSAIRRYQSGLEQMLGKADRDFRRLEESLVQKQELAKKRGDLKAVEAINTELSALRIQLEQLQKVLSGETMKDLVQDADKKTPVAQQQIMALGNNVQQKAKTIRATIRADQESGTSLGVPVKAGDVLTVQYVTGQWSNKSLGTASPDNTGEPQLRLSIAGWSRKNNLHNSQIVTVPNGTAGTPFSYKFTDDFDNVSLRINDVWGVFADNQGFVIYDVSFTQ